MTSLTKFSISAIAVGVISLAWLYSAILRSGFAIYIPILDITIHP